MSMTREEAVRFAEHAANMTDIPEVKEFYRLSAAALRPVSREQVEKVWRGCNECTSCKLCIWNETKKCNGCKNMYSFKPLSDFCPRCGKPLTDEAVEMVMERLEALKDAES